MLTDVPTLNSPSRASMEQAVMKPSDGDQFALKRVTFQTVAPLGTAVFLSFIEPESRVALLEDKGCGEWSQALAVDPQNVQEGRPHHNDGPDFDVVCVNAAAAGADAIQRAERWIDPDGSSGPNASVLVKMAGGKDRWVRAKNGRAVVCATKAEWDGLVAALADFFFYEFELRKLEREIAANWGRAETDLPLAGDVASDDLKRLGEIGTMSRMVLTRRIRLAKLERPLYRCQAPLPLPARKLAARLRTKFDVEDRAETLDGQLEVYEYIYEMANQRLGEYKNFRREYILEILIVVLLASEVVLMILDFIRNSSQQ